MVQLASHSTFCSSSRRISSSAAEIFSPVFVMAAASYHAAELLLAVSHLQPGTPSPGAFGADLSPAGRGDRACGSDGATDTVDLSPPELGLARVRHYKLAQVGYIRLGLERSRAKRAGEGGRQLADLLLPTAPAAPGGRPTAGRPCAAAASAAAGSARASDAGSHR